MYEQGRREPSAELLVRLARVLEVSVDYLLTGQPLPGEQEKIRGVASQAVLGAQLHTQNRKAPLSREELAVLFAALLLES
jgi:transcriptional regulator with XRE-family HTH domain